MGNILLMINNYFHDLSVALLASNIFAVYFIGKYLDGNPTGDKIIPMLYKKLSWITYFAFAYIIIGGGIRAYYFNDFEWNPAVGKGQIAALIVKHVVLVSITLFGVIVQIRYHRKYGHAE